MLVPALIATAAGIAASLQLMAGHFALGGALMLVSVLAVRWPRSMWTGAAPADLPPRTRRLALLGVCALAVFFRAYHIDQPGLWGDDALNGLLAFAILDGKVHSPFELVRHSYSTFHALSNYPMAASFWLFGAHLSTLRLPGVVLSALCVPLLYGIIAPLFGSSVALIAALLCASSPPQLTHAKVLVQVVTGQFFLMSALCLLVRGIAARRAWLIIAAGIPLAGCIYTYHAAKLAPLVVFAYAFAVLIGRQTSARRELGIALALMLAVFAVALLPALRGYAKDPNALVGHVDAESIWAVIREQHSYVPLWNAVWRTLMIFHYQQGPEYYWFGISYDPALDVVVGFLFIHGLVETLAHWREPRAQLLLAWFVIGLVPGFLSAGAPRIYRAFLAMPPIYVWAALPLARLLSVRTARQPAWAGAVAAALLCAVPLMDFNYYFYRVYTHPGFRWYQGERLVEMARTLRSFGPGWTGYLLTDAYEANHETLIFLSRAWNLQIRDVSNLSDVLPLSELPSGGALFMMSQSTIPAAAAIAEMYPGEQLTPRAEPEMRSWWFDGWWRLAPDGAPAVTTAYYPVTHSAAEHPNLEPPRGLIAEYDLDTGHVTRAEPYPFFAFFGPAFPSGVNAHGGVELRGTLTVPAPGNVRLMIDTNAAAVLLLDGHPHFAASTVAAGTHDFVLSVAAFPDRFRLEIAWQFPDQPPIVVPPDAFSPLRAATRTAN
jgi:4-amino-4-deoxy-L-arabinose transferase-like glycosyltransferase